MPRGARANAPSARVGRGTEHELFLADLLAIPQSTEVASTHGHATRSVGRINAIARSPCWPHVINR